MIKYDTAVKLKEVGISQRGEGWLYLPGSELPYSPDEINALSVKSDKSWEEVAAMGYYAPTLEEFIEACGDSFRYLDRTKNEWYAHGASNPEGDAIVVDIHTRGTSPTEAVANLYLELHK